MPRRVRVAAVLAACLGLFAAPVRGASATPAPPVFLLGVEDSSGLATLLRTETDRAYEDAAAYFESTLDAPITVVWAGDADTFRRVAGRDPGPIAGLAFPPQRRIVLFAPALMSRPDRIVPVLRHEMWHLLFARATEHAAVEPPRWLDEGLATWRCGEWDLDLELRRDRDAWIRDASAAGALFPFDELDARFPEGPRLPLAYAQSASFVEWLAGLAGEQKLPELFRALNRDLDPDPAFRATWGEGLATLERRWRDQTVPGGLLGRLPSAATLGVWLGVVLGILVVSAYVRGRRRIARLPDEGSTSPPEG